MGPPHDVRDPVYPPGGQLLLKLALDPRAGGRVVEEHRAQGHHGRPGEKELKGVAAGPDAAAADDRHVRQRLPDRPDAAHRDRAAGGAGKPPGGPQGRATETMSVAPGDSLGKTGMSYRADPPTAATTAPAAASSTANG